MNRVSSTYRKSKKFLTEDIWKIDIEELSRFKASAVKYTKILILTLKTFSAQKIGFQAVALSFFGTMSVVPFIAVTFVVTGGLGISDRLKELLYANFSDNQNVIDMVLGFADNIITTARSSTMGLVSALLFIWLVFWMMMSVERVFNNVWKVHKSRNFFKRFSFYVLILVISPFIIMLFFSGSIIYSNLLESTGLDIKSMETFSSFLGWVIFYIIATLTFSAMYKFIPNARVMYSNALRSAVISGLAFTVLQYLYLGTQVFVTRLNMVYGAVAAIPLFMFWMNFGWFIILFGAELSYAYQNVDNYNIEN
ncbi:MAG: YihY/virulence factor BrkB family protein [Bacteroidetes bacterium]|uniref:YihY/virulence factor BrkB family protein n=1 Tax=Candidatus Cryptobacteroides excrementipullorum TaxID=2840761 RepID=A0A9D9IUC2_9BACT|nr:YihY/virulence factor BrkB family protein [Candidatus Cryptobacteroides excrementipullorum]